MSVLAQNIQLAVNVYALPNHQLLFNNRMFLPSLIMPVISTYGDSGDIHHTGTSCVVMENICKLLGMLKVSSERH